MNESDLGKKIEQIIPPSEEEKTYLAGKTFAEAILKHMKGYKFTELDVGIDEIESAGQDWLDDKSWPFSERKKKLIDKVRRMNLAEIFTRKGSFNFAVHRRYQGGKYINAPDFDGAMALWFLEKAGADTRRIKYAYPGEKPAKDIFAIDFGKKIGVIPPKDEGDRTVVVDHHVADLEAAKERGLTLKQILETCSAKFIFEGLEGCGLFDQTDKTGERLNIEALGKMAELAMMTDNKRYPHNKETFNSSWQTVLGLYQYMKFEDIYEFFKRGGKATDKIDPQDLVDPQKWGLSYKQKDGIVSLPEKRRQMIKDANERIRRLEADGYVVEIPNREGRKLRFLVDYIHEEMPEERRKMGTVLRTDAALAHDYDGVILYNQETKSIFVNIDPLTEDTIHLNADSLVNVRGKMIITDALRRNYMNLSLRELIEKLGGDPFKIKSRLRDALETNDDWVEKQKRPEGKETHCGLVIFFGEMGWSAILPGNLIVSLPAKDEGYDARFLYDVTIENLSEGGFKVIAVKQTNEKAPDPELLSSENL